MSDCGTKYWQQSGVKSVGDGFFAIIGSYQVIALVNIRTSVDPANVSTRLPGIDISPVSVLLPRPVCDMI